VAVARPPGGGQVRQGERMPGFVITSVFEVPGGKFPLGQDVLATIWGTGHRFSYCDGRMLTLVVELVATDRAAAFESVLSRVEQLWPLFGGGRSALPGPPITMRVQGAVEPEKVPAGRPGRAVRLVDSLRLSNLPSLPNLPNLPTLPRRRRTGWPVGWLPGEDDGWLPGEDDGGLAGVREPRRPLPGPPGLSAARDLPPTG
jgi:hypothetical protein